MGAEALAQRAPEALNIELFNGMDLEAQSPLQAMIAKAQNGPEAIDSSTDLTETAISTNSVEAVTEHYASNMLGRLGEGIKERAHKLGDFVRNGRAVALGALTLGAAAVVETGVASASGTTQGPAQSETTTYTASQFSYQINGGKVLKDKAFAKAVLVGNHRTVAKAQVKEDMREGNCDTFTASEVVKEGIKTQGYMGTGVGYAYENRASTMCDSDQDGKYDYRAECGNKAKGSRPMPEIAKTFVWVNDLSKAKLRVRAKVAAGTTAYCATESGYASAYAYAEGKSSAKVKLSSVVTAEGKAKIKTDQEVSAKAKARANAKVKAVAYCFEQSGVTVTVTANENCPEGQYAYDTDNDGVIENGECTPYKDGTTTPQPPTEAPGPNPTPSPEEPEGSNPCYDEETGQSVEPENGLCPPGSYGDPNQRSAAPNKVLV